MAPTISDEELAIMLQANNAGMSQSEWLELQNPVDTIMETSLNTSHESMEGTGNLPMRPFPDTFMEEHSETDIESLFEDRDDSSNTSMEGTGNLPMGPGPGTFMGELSDTNFDSMCETMGGPSNTYMEGDFNPNNGPFDLNPNLALNSDAGASFNTDTESANMTMEAAMGTFGGAQFNTNKPSTALPMDPTRNISSRTAFHLNISGAFDNLTMVPAQSSSAAPPLDTQVEAANIKDTTTPIVTYEWAQSYFFVLMHHTRWHPSRLAQILNNKTHFNWPTARWMACYEQVKDAQTPLLKQLNAAVPREQPPLLMERLDFLNCYVISGESKGAVVERKVTPFVAEVVHFGPVPTTATTTQHTTTMNFALQYHYPAHPIPDSAPGPQFLCQVAPSSNYTQNFQNSYPAAVSDNNAPPPYQHQAYSIDNSGMGTQYQHQEALSDNDAPPPYQSQGYSIDNPGMGTQYQHQEAPTLMFLAPAPAPIPHHQHQQPQAAFPSHHRPSPKHRMKASNTTEKSPIKRKARATPSKSQNSGESSSPPKRQKKNGGPSARVSCDNNTEPALQEQQQQQQQQPQPTEESPGLKGEALRASMMRKSYDWMEKSGTMRRVTGELVPVAAAGVGGGNEVAAQDHGAGKASAAQEEDDFDWLGAALEKAADADDGPGEASVEEEVDGAKKAPVEEVVEDDHDWLGEALERGEE